MATDTAFVIGCLAFLGSRIPRSLRVFVLSLEVADDIGAVLVVAIGYSSDLDWRMLRMAAVGVAAIRGVARLGGVFPPGDHWSGDTEDRRSLQVAAVAARETLSPVERLEIALHSWVGFVIMPLFALANAGVPLTFRQDGDPMTMAVFAGFVVGKAGSPCVLASQYSLPI